MRGVTDSGGPGKHFCFHSEADGKLLEGSEQKRHGMTSKSSLGLLGLG